MVIGGIAHLKERPYDNHVCRGSAVDVLITGERTGIVVSSSRACSKCVGDEERWAQRFRKDAEVKLPGWFEGGWEEATEELQVEEEGSFSLSSTLILPSDLE